MVIPA